MKTWQEQIKPDDVGHAIARTHNAIRVAMADGQFDLVEHYESALMELNTMRGQGHQLSLFPEMVTP